MPSVFLIAVGGPTSSGKTTLAKSLVSVLPKPSSILHLDDFAPPAEQIPVHPVHKVQDWDDPDGAIDWPRYRKALEHLLQTGKFPPEHLSHDHLNEQTPIPIDQKVVDEWRDRFQTIVSSNKDKQNAFVIADGFLLFADPSITALYDIKFFVKHEYAVLKQRRHDRHGYHTAVQSDPDGGFWRDPPDYWDNIVWPAYIKANAHLFNNKDVENGTLNPQPKPEDFPIHDSTNDSSSSSPTAEPIVPLDGRDLSASQMLDQACRAIYDSLTK